MWVCIFNRMPLACSAARWFTLDARARPTHFVVALKEALVTWLMLLVGLVVGLVSGVVGIGGGILFVPALI